MLILLLLYDTVLGDWVSVPPDQQRSYATGLRRPVMSYVGAPVEVLSQRPATLDWRNIIGHDIPVRDQGSCGSCWAFATVGPLEFALQRLLNTSGVDLSEQHLVSCNTNGFSCAGGGWWAFDMVQETGFVSEVCFPYVAHDQPCAPRCGPMMDVQLAGWRYVDRYGGTPDVDTMQSAIQRWGPLAVAVSVGNEFFAYRSGVFAFHYTGGVNHAVTVIGWDDGLQAWLVRNSWGVQWGMGGHMWIAYGVSNIGDGAAYPIVVLNTRQTPAIISPSPSTSPGDSPSPLRPRCQEALPVTCFAEAIAITGSTQNVQWADVEALCAEAPTDHRGAWFRFQVYAGARFMELHTVGSEFDTQLSLYYDEGCGAPNWKCMATNDDVAPDNISSRLYLSEPRAGKYWIYLHGYAHWAGQYRLSVSCQYAFTCSRAVQAQCNQMLEGDTLSANVDGSIRDCTAAPSVGATVWFVLHIKPPVTGLTLDTAGSDFDTQLSVYTGPACTPRRCLASNDDVSGSRWARLELTVTATRYMIAVHGYGGLWGHARLLIRCIR